MNIKPIRSDEDLTNAFKRLEVIFQAEAGTPEADEMEVLVTLIEVYENKHYSIESASPIEAIKFQMDQRGLKLKDLQAFLGSAPKSTQSLKKSEFSFTLTSTSESYSDKLNSFMYFCFLSSLSIGIFFLISSSNSSVTLIGGMFGSIKYL